MKLKATLRAGTVVAAVLLGSLNSLPAAQAQDAPSTVQNAQDGLALGVGKGTLVRLPRAMSDVFVANNKIADVQVRSPTLLYVFGTGSGETSIYATDKGGRVVYSASVRVAQNIDQIKTMLSTAMPGAAIAVTPMNGMVLLTGTVANPSEVEEATRLVQSFVGDKTTVVTKLRTAMPVQVNLQVKIAEVSRDLLKEVGVNLLAQDPTSGFQFGIFQGRDFASIGPTDLSGYPTLDASNLFGLPAGSLDLPFDPSTGNFLFGGTTTTFNAPTSGATALNFAGQLFGLDVAAALDLLEQDGVISLLAEPNLTAISGETASFLAGGEFPITVVDGDGRVSVEFKEYGVGLAFTPTVLDSNRISLRVRPEVSELTDAGAITLSNITIPALTTRRAETTIELGSGQSFMIGGLIRNRTNTNANRAAGLADLPIIGALFKSDKFQRQETELVIVVTPYLVKPVAANKIMLPTDGYQAPTDLQRFFLGKTFDGKNEQTRPQTRMVPAVPSTRPSAAPTPNSAAPAGAAGASAPAPGFSN